MTENETDAAVAAEATVEAPAPEMAETVAATAGEAPAEAAETEKSDSPADAAETDAAKTKKHKRAPRAKPVLDHDRLKRLAGTIEDLRHSRLHDLHHQLETEEGLKVIDKGNVTHVNLAGLQASSTAGLNDALSNWANAARRAAIAAEVA